MQDQERPFECLWRAVSIELVHPFLHLLLFAITRRVL